MMDEWATVDVPANYSVMLSFLAVNIERHPTGDCGYDRLTVYTGDGEKPNSATRQVLCNGSPIPAATVLHADVLYFHFVSDDVVELSGFRLQFSFHPDSDVPKKTASGKWNCSLTLWPQIQMHFPCNMLEDCEGGKDEANCPYADKACGPGHFAVGGGCYAMLVENRPITWNEAASECLRRDEYLASLNTPAEWEAVITSTRRYFVRDVYFGLQTSAAKFPEM